MSVGVGDVGLSCARRGSEYSWSYSWSSWFGGGWTIGARKRGEGDDVSREVGAKTSITAAGDAIDIWMEMRICVCECQWSGEELT